MEKFHWKKIKDFERFFSEIKLLLCYKLFAFAFKKLTIENNLIIIEVDTSQY